MSTSKTYEVTWGSQKRALSVPRENLAVELLMTDLPPLPDVYGAILQAVENPIGCPPLSAQLRPGYKVALMTGDRITDRMLGTRDGVGLKLLDYLNRLGIKDEDVTLIFAGGSHANPDWDKRLGADLMRRVKTMKHDHHNEKGLKFVGVTSYSTPVWVNKVVVDADFSLAVGEISPTVHGGWCGGGKIILPGVAGMDTIEQNHCALVKEVNTVGLADGNHMRLDMEESARLAGLGMKVDILVNSQAQVVGVYAGDFLREHRAALPQARRIWMTKMDPVDIMVVYPGEGHEEHLSSCMWIRFEGSDVGLKDGGIIIMALSAVGGWAAEARLAQDQVCPAEVLKMSTEENARLMVRRQGNVRNLSMVYSAKRILERRRVFLVCDGISAQDAKEFGFAYCTPSFQEALNLALAERGKDARIGANIQSQVGWRTLPWREG